MVVDGEHYPPVIAAALDELRARGHEIAGAVLAGGKEKVGPDGLARLGDLDVRTSDDPRDALDKAILDLAPEAVMDLSDEPVLDYRRRHEMAAVALFREVSYEGADFRFGPPVRERLANRPSIALTGTGKRTGKTAIAGFTARTLSSAGAKPVIVAMGRGGPPEPEVMRGDEVELEARDLLELADGGKHAASDYVEDALLGRVPTVGCRRCGGGLAGGIDISNVADGVRLANDLPGDLLLLEGSGSSIPPVRADVTGLVIPASIPMEYLTGYMGPYRVLLSDFAVVTMCENPFGSPSQISEISSYLRRAFRKPRSGDRDGAIRVVRTVFRPTPVRSVEDARAFVATTAPEAAGGSIKAHLEDRYRCQVVGMSHSLSDRAKLEKEMEGLEERADLLLCEIKAAGIDVATRRALEKGLDVVYMDNVPVGVEGDDPAELIQWAADLARERYAEST